MAPTRGEGGEWAVSADIDCPANPLTDEDLAHTRYAIHHWIYGTPLALGLPPMSEDLVAKKTATGIHIGFHIGAATERDAWGRSVPLIVGLVFNHPKAGGWSSVSVPRIELKLTQL